MNGSQPYMDSHSQQHMSASQPYAPYPAPSSHYQSYQQPPSGPSLSHYQPPQYQASSYGYPGGVPQSPQSVGHHSSAPQVPSQAIQLPAMHMPAPSPSHNYVAASQPPSAGYQQQQQQQHQMDITGQTGPPGIKPKVTATLWEDEGSLCFQVEAKGVCVARREDNHFINGTKLLNVAGMTRGRRDGILKSEKVRHVVKIGPMHLKGVWIPFERALDFANKEKITDQLYPLFVHNIGSLLYNPESINRSSQGVAATERRRMDSTDPGRSSQAPQPPPLHHHHSMQSTVGSQPQHSIAPHPDAGRPSIGRAHTFPNVPTPPTSASSVLGMGNPGNSYWDGQNLANNVASAQPLSIDTGLSNNNARSMPTTPATTPPGGSMQPYQNQQSYDPKPYTSYPPASQNGYASQPRMNTYPQDASFKSEMGPPSAPGAVPTESEHHDGKADVYSHVNGGAESVHHEQGYPDPNASAYGANRGHYAYNPSATHQHVSPEMTGSPSHQTNSGRGTPRTMPGQQQWSQDYQTPPRSAPASSVYSVMGDSRSSNGGSGEYTASSYSSSSQPTISNKRGREDDDHDRPASRDLDYKRQKNYGAPMGSANHMQAIATGGGMPRQR